MTDKVLPFREWMRASVPSDPPLPDVPSDLPGISETLIQVVEVLRKQRDFNHAQADWTRGAMETFRAIEKRLEELEEKR